MGMTRRPGKPHARVLVAVAVDDDAQHRAHGGRPLHAAPRASQVRLLESGDWSLTV